jgi:heme-degrading monooxygenase HmoA
MQTLRSSTLPPRIGTKAATAAAAAAALALGAGAQAQAQPIGGDGFAAGSAVAAIVKVPTPWYAPRFVVVRKMRDTIPQYQALPGLAYKAFSFAQADGDYGGIYLWKDLASARAWFDPAWFERVQKERGNPGEVRFFEVLAAIDNTPGGTPADNDSSAVATLATWPAPAGTDRPQWAAPLQSALAAERQIPGLLRRYVVVTDAGRVGHISLWRDRASAQRWFDGAAEGNARSFGADAAVEWFDTPILMPSPRPENQPRIPGL